jgi:SAM-dependent methyltransferase
MAARGENVHGEADFVVGLGLSFRSGTEPAFRSGTEPAFRSSTQPGAGSVLDAGCGTGRVAIELARRGLDVVGVDVDADMLARAREKAPDVPWVEADLVGVDLGRRFEVVLLAGNVMIFLAPGTEAAVVANLARHLAPGGALVAGFQLDRLDLATYDRYAADAGLRLDERWATWDRGPFVGGDYAVSVHRPEG